ncbi:MAG: hypothetical protein IIZ67_05385 [Bacilli bacterium]|nr:hypothetical protein [Bacilli bacterium]
MIYKLSSVSERELKRVVNNFNAKIRRLENVDREIDIPEKESIKAIKERVTNKWELNREIDRLQRFTKRNAEELIQNKSGVVLSRWEFENLQREQRRLSARLLRDIERFKKTKPTEFGEEQGFTFGQMGDDKLTNMQARYKAISSKKLKKINLTQLKRLKTYLKTTNYNYSKDKKVIFYNNFLDGTLLYAGNVVGYDYKKLDYIREQLGSLTPEQFLKAFNSELSLRYIVDKIISPEKDETLTNEEITEMEKDIIPVLDELYENMPKIIDTYKI